jgi:hypothetical protein
MSAEPAVPCFVISQGFGGGSSGAKWNCLFLRADDETQTRRSSTLVPIMSEQGYNLVDDEETGRAAQAAFAMLGASRVVIASSRGGKLAARMLLSPHDMPPVIAISALSTDAMVRAVLARPGGSRTRLLLLHGAHDLTNTIDRVRESVRQAAAACPSVKLIVFPLDDHSLRSCPLILPRVVHDLVGDQKLFDSLPPISVFDAAAGGALVPEATVAGASIEKSSGGFAGGFCKKCNRCCPQCATHKCATCGCYPSMHAAAPPGEAAC